MSHGEQGFWRIRFSMYLAKLVFSAVKWRSNSAFLSRLPRTILRPANTDPLAREKFPGAVLTLLTALYSSLLTWPFAAFRLGAGAGAALNEKPPAPMLACGAGAGAPKEKPPAPIEPPAAAPEEDPPPPPPLAPGFADSQDTHFAFAVGGF